MAITPASELHASREAALREVGLDCLRRLDACETFLDASIERSHPELMPELTSELAEVRRIHAAGRLAERARNDSPRSPTAASEAVLRIRCPECRTPTDVLADSDFDNVTCGSCGTQFGLVGQPGNDSGALLQTRIGHFELLEQIGLGGYGAVWKARDKELDRLVAIKIPRRGLLNPEEVEQFLREARAAAQMRHPHIVAVHEVGRDDELVYLVSDLVDGPSLAEWLTKGRMAVPEAARLCQKIALALQHAHLAGIVHRDLKPGNVLLDSAGEPHLTDFGLALRRARETTVTHDGQCLGTPAYMSPEQARGDSHTADGRSDIYSLGAVLYEILTGELPFRGNPANVLHQIMHEDPRSPRSLNRHVPRDLETITLKCLEKVPSRRYATARDLADDLGHFLQHEPIHARPISKSERLWRWCRRRPVVAGLTAAVATLLMAVAVVTSYASVRAHGAAEAARWQQYLSDIHLAMQAWEEGDAGRALQLLERHVPAAGQEDLRRFEWHYLWRQCHSGPTNNVLPQESRVNGIAISPDGQLLAVAEDDSTYTVDVWRLDTMRKLHTLPGQLGAWHKHVAFSPDGRWLAAGCTDRSIRLWDMETGKLSHTFNGHTDVVWDVAFSPNGKLLASASWDHTVRLWDAETAALVHTFASDDAAATFASVAISPDGRFLAAGSSDATASLWDVDSRALIRSFVGHAGDVRKVEFSVDGATLATASADGTAKLWHVADGALLKTLSGHTDGLTGIAFAPDGATIASTGGDGTIRLWDVASAKQRSLLRGHSGRVLAVTYTPDGTKLVTGGADAAVRFWDISAVGEPDVLRGHVNEVVLDVHPDGRTIASVGRDGPVRFWDLPAGKLLETRPFSSGKHLMMPEYSPSGARLAVGDETGYVELWDLGTSTAVPLRHSSQINALAWSGDERTLAAGYADGEVVLWDVATATPRRKLPGHKNGICAVAYSPDGQTLVTRCEDHKLRIWDPRLGTLRQTIDDPAYFGCAMAFSRDGRILASGSGDLSIKFWATGTWTLVRSLRGHADRTQSLAFSPDGLTLASGADDGQIKLWEIATGEERGTLRGHVGAVYAVCFTPDGRTLVSAGRDGTIRLWRTADSVEATSREGSPPSLVRSRSDLATLVVGFSPRTISPIRKGYDLPPLRHTTSGKG